MRTDLLGINDGELPQMMVNAGISGRVEKLRDLMREAQMRALVFAVGMHRTRELFDGAPAAGIDSEGGACD